MVPAAFSPLQEKEYMGAVGKKPHPPSRWRRSVKLAEPQEGGVRDGEVAVAGDVKPAQSERQRDDLERRGKIELVSSVGVRGGAGKEEERAERDPDSGGRAELSLPPVCLPPSF